MHFHIVPLVITCEENTQKKSNSIIKGASPEIHCKQVSAFIRSVTGPVF